MTDPEEPMIIASGGWCAPSDTNYIALSADHNAKMLIGFTKRTPEEWAEIRAKQKAAVEAKMVVAQQRYREVRNRLLLDESSARARAALDRIAERHQPKAGSYAVECSCWHNQGYEVEAADWPCDDFNDVAEAVGL